MQTETITLNQFIEKHGLKFECRRVESRPDGFMDDSPRHFRCHISQPYGGKVLRPNKWRSFGLYFSQGSAHTVDPTLEEVLDCLASDASGYENALASHPALAMCKTPFESWAFEFGYDFDSRAAEKIFKTVKRQANQLKRVLGEEAYQELLWNTERL